MPKKLRQVLIALGVLLGAGFVLLVAFLLFVLPFFDMPDNYNMMAFEFVEEMALAKKTPSGVEYTVNNSTASFRLDVEGPDDHCGRLFRDYASALAYCKEHGLGTIPSVQLVQGKQKQFDDGLVAALELAMERGLPGHDVTGKREALSALAKRLGEMRAEAGPSAKPHVEQALVHILTALALGGGAPAGPSDVSLKVEAAKADFLERADLSKPIGFWTWSEELGRVFVQDRFLSRGLALPDDAGAVVALSLAISRDPGLAEAFARLRDFGARLTNPPTWIDTDEILAPERACVPFEAVAALVPEGASLDNTLAPDGLARVSAELAKRFGKRAGFALVAYSESKEYDLLRRVALTGGLSGRAATMEAIVEAVRSGRLSLEPRPGAGWYDYQQHALETLLVPERGRESAKLHLSDAYKERLKNAFATILTKNRETHIKRLPVLLLCGSLASDEPPPVVEIGPEFSVEPTVTVYLRLARGYRFLANSLRAVLGEDALAGVRRLNEDGSLSETSLDRELREAALKLYGIYEMLSVEIGQRPEYLEGEISAGEIIEAKTVAARWLGSLATDADLARDTRVAVPIAVMDIGGPTRFWGTAGVRLERVVYEYKEEPRVEGRIEPVFVPTRYYLATDVFAEFERPGITPLTRAEWRALCDNYDNWPSLLVGLGALNRPAPHGFPYEALVAGLVLLALAGGAGAAAYRYRERLRGIEWRRVFHAIWNRRVFKWTGAALGALLLVWILALMIFPRYRVRFLVKYVARLNTPLGLACEMRLVPSVPPVPRTEELIALMGHPDAQVRYLAARSLTMSWCHEYWGRQAEELAVLRRDDIRARLQAAADDPEPDVALAAIMALDEAADPRNTDFLLAKLRERQSSALMRRMLVWALGKTGVPKVLDAVLPLTYDAGRRLRRGAVMAIANFNDERAARRLIELVRSPDAKTSNNAACAISQLRERFPENAWEREFDEALLAAVQNTAVAHHWRSRCANHIVARGLRIKAYLAIIRSPTSKEEPWCFEGAVRELGDIGPDAREAVPEIEKLLEHPDEDVRDAARRALEKIRDER